MLLFFKPSKGSALDLNGAIQGQSRLLFIFCCLSNIQAELLNTYIPSFINAVMFYLVVKCCCLFCFSVPVFRCAGRWSVGTQPAGAGE